MLFGENMPPEVDDFVLPSKQSLDGNLGDSPLTTHSPNALIFGTISLITSFGVVFLNRSFWMAAVASSPSAAYRAFTLAGLG